MLTQKAEVNMRVLITGGRGFVGFYVVAEMIYGGHEVTVLSNLSHPSELHKGQSYEYGDVRYEYDIERALDKTDCVIHLAAKINVDRSRENARPFFDINVLGTYNILEVCRKKRIKLIHASTSEALGSMQVDRITELGMNEDHPYSPDNPYGATKAAADMLVYGWIKSYDIDATILRSFNITGIGQSYDKEGAFIPKTIESIINDEDPTIFGSGQQTRDYVWVGDVARAYRLLAEGDHGGKVFHVGSGTEVSIAFVAEKLIEISGKPLKVQYVKARPKEVKRLKSDYSRIKKLGWKPTKSIDDILREMYEYRFSKEFS